LTLPAKTLSTLEESAEAMEHRPRKLPACTHCHQSCSIIDRFPLQIETASARIGCDQMEACNLTLDLYADKVFGHTRAVDVTSDQTLNHCMSQAL